MDTMNRTARTLSEDETYALAGEFPDETAGRPNEDGDPYAVEIFFRPGGFGDGFVELPAGFYGMETSGEGDRTGYRFAGEADMLAWFDDMRDGLRG